MPFAITLTAVVVIGLIAVVSRQWLKQASRYRRLPPGPRPHPLYGNKIPSFPWRHYHQLSKHYGPLITIWEGRTPIVICNDFKTTTELLEKHARDTADRPVSIIANAASGNMRLLQVPYSEKWRRLRKAVHFQLQPQSARNFQPVQKRAACHLIGDILDKPEAFQSHIQTYASTVIASMAYGRTDRASYSDPDVKQIFQITERLSRTIKPGEWSVETFHILQHVPGYLNLPHKWHKDELGLYRSKLQKARQAIAQGGTAPCFAEYITTHQEEYQISDDEMAYLCGGLFLAGSDTSASAIAITIMAAALFPEQQKMVQDELDKVIDGSSRLPDFTDEDELPTLLAFIRETYRWRPVSAGGFQHRTLTDLTYDTYVIPKGTRIAGNHWAIHRDPEVFPNPEVFDLNRWLVKQDDGRVSLNSNLKHFQFGFGRRVCPGQHVANRSVFINAALLLWAFKITPKTDDAGQELAIDADAFTTTPNSHPLPFQVAFHHRQADIRASLAA